MTVAAARAAETARADSLISDPLAAVLIEGPELSDVVALMAKRSGLYERLPNYAAFQRQVVDYHAARTHFFDAFFSDAGAAGIRQHVILASGLDSRAFRLAWPPNTTVFEIDQPGVLAYKAATLAAHGAEPTATWRQVPIDLRQDWPASLRACGFDARQPSAWSAEGVLPFLTGSGQDDLFCEIDTLSVPGSRIALETYRADGSLPEAIAQMNRQMTQLAEQSDDFVDDIDLWYGDEGRTEPADWFTRHAWDVQSIGAPDYLARLGRPLLGTDPTLFALASFVTALRS